MKFQKGQSGNPSGRPPKSRALTEILERAGNVTVDVGADRKVARKRILADLTWQLATTGSATFPDGVQLNLEPGDWLALLKFLYQHIDGPPKTELDVTSGGQPILKVEYVNDWRNQATLPASGADSD
jgi:hypothetical protein